MSQNLDDRNKTVVLCCCLFENLKGKQTLSLRAVCDSLVLSLCGFSGEEEFLPKILCGGTWDQTHTHHVWRTSPRHFPKPPAHPKKQPVFLIFSMTLPLQNQNSISIHSESIHDSVYFRPKFSSLSKYPDTFVHSMWMVIWPRAIPVVCLIS